MQQRRDTPFSKETSAEQAEAEEAAWRVVDQLRARNADIDPDEVLAEVTAEVEAVRQERYEQRTAARQSGR